jgi:hypothetical protein
MNEKMSPERAAGYARRAGFRCQAREGLTGKPCSREGAGVADGKWLCPTHLRVADHARAFGRS